uniref:Uncharacterized protein n=1 Tax=Romanomermis culicivorax TaxID=13658 RepID=A0A915JUL1_ROMCU
IVYATFSCKEVYGRSFLDQRQKRQAEESAENSQPADQSDATTPIVTEVSKTTDTSTLPSTLSSTTISESTSLSSSESSSDFPAVTDSSPSKSISSEDLTTTSITESITTQTSASDAPTSTTIVSNSSDPGVAEAATSDSSVKIESSTGNDAASTIQTIVTTKIFETVVTMGTTQKSTDESGQTSTVNDVSSCQISDSCSNPVRQVMNGTIAPFQFWHVDWSASPAQINETIVRVKFDAFSKIFTGLRFYGECDIQLIGYGCENFQHIQCCMVR